MVLHYVMILPAAQTPASSADETKMSPNGAILLNWNDIDSAQLSKHDLFNLKVS